MTPVTEVTRVTGVTGVKRGWLESGRWWVVVGGGIAAAANIAGAEEFAPGELFSCPG